MIATIVNLYRLPSFFVTFTLLLLFITPLRASHIVGGEIHYECLGGNQYSVTLKQYRDCSGINFPDPAQIDVYNSTGTLLQTITIPLPATVVLTPTPPGPCTSLPAGVCVEAVEYVATVNLPPIPGGYTLEYNDCCRNAGIINGPSGRASYATTIPDISLAACNSSPEFTDYPPVVICQNVALSLDHSATDADGDSLYYSMCSPMEDALAPTPYTFSAPYTTADPIGGSMAIDGQTGLLTGTPPTTGRFVVGVCVSEYRNGSLLSTTTRDFQFNVVECTEVAVAAALSALTDCSNLEVSFSIVVLEEQVIYGTSETVTLLHNLNRYIIIVV